MAIDCQQVTNRSIDCLDYLLPKYMIIVVALRNVGPQCSLFALLKFVIAYISDQLFCRLGRHCPAGYKREGNETVSVNQHKYRSRKAHDRSFWRPVRDTAARKSISPVSVCRRANLQSRLLGSFLHNSPVQRYMPQIQRTWFQTHGSNLTLTGVGVPANSLHNVDIP
jgi:hypothetical protein